MDDGRLLQTQTNVAGGEVVNEPDALEESIEPPLVEDIGALDKQVR